MLAGEQGCFAKSDSNGMTRACVRLCAWPRGWASLLEQVLVRVETEGAGPAVGSELFCSVAARFLGKSIC